MSEHAPNLDPIHLPLPGSRLIEASAGTGKTFTIALLYLRLVLGPSDADDTAAFPRPLTPPEILVVTFTNAATQELRERIRARLVEAADAFQADTSAAGKGSGDAEGAPGTGADKAPPETGDLFAEPQGSAEPVPDSASTAERPADPLLALRDSYPGKAGRPAPAACAWPPNGWTKPPSPPSTPGATACCASTPSTAAACSP
ncbi:RecBCD enzyme subunit RecB [Halomonas elongata]|uniref:RecBCD enzyme subunit RecB n=1 Tax=Halomonas elongata TaxID=2746 RepID=A0A1B8P6G2_HALEL|nr:RecBCD enzyme subunit RecB [Halomonas elongata]